MSRYRKIEVKTWSDEQFRQLSPMPPSGQGLWFFLLTGPHTGPIPGLFRAGRAALAEELGWDEEGFDEMDKRILESIIGLFDGGPVGVNSLAVAIGEEPGTIEEVHEPFLIMQGFLKRTAQGRVAMPKAYRKLGLDTPAKAVQDDLL